MKLVHSTLLATMTTFILFCTSGISEEKEKAPDKPDAVIAALNAFSAHISEEKKLDDKALDVYRKTLDANKGVFSTNTEVIKLAQALVADYDTKIGPLWINYKNLHKKTRTEGDAIHWGIFWVMQYIFDGLYTTDGMKNHQPLIDSFRFGCADHFPGKVEPPKDPTSVHTVKINGSYPKTWGGPLFQMERPARKPTGTYLVPGTIATVTVPESLVNKGYQVRVGAHSWDLTKKPKVLRLYRVSAVYDITSTEINVANPLGGGIYIEVPYEADAGVVEVSVKGAARSPYFSWKPFHKTSLKEWREVERNFKAPWADFQSERFMTQVPTSWIYKLDDPVTLMQDWDKAIDAANDLMGRPHLFGKEIIYAQVDLQLRGRAFHPGYPSGNRGYDPTKDYGGNHDNHLVRGPQYAHSYEFHEQGHGYLFPKYSGDREAAVNLPYVAVLNRAFDVDLEEAFRKSRSIPNKFVTLDHTAIAWMMCDHFVDQSGMLGYERQYQAKGHAKFVDVVRLFGWEVLGNFFKSMHQDYMDGKPWGNNSNDGDTYTIRMSEVAHADLRPLMHFWGIPTEKNTESDAAVVEKKIAPSAKVYDLLIKYKELVPKNNQAFREFAEKWWGKQPNPKGFTEERNHAARWEAYNEEAAAKTTHVVQEIIDRYFPNGRPEVK